ncbi:MAG TPA: TetR family transcriptional regulator, partial [Amycolatopsis sp.]|nr:TetR family transcriptional regulator [Amycolatopsis sp.]
MTASRRYSGKTADERRAERRLALLGAALDIWQEQGWAAVTMRGVCARANLTDRYFYESFANRDVLL